MKNLIKILLLLTLMISCSDPDITGGGTDIEIDDNVNFRIILNDNVSFISEQTNVSLIKSEDELRAFNGLYSMNDGIQLTNEISSKVDFESEMLLVILRASNSIGDEDIDISNIKLTKDGIEILYNITVKTMSDRRLKSRCLIVKTKKYDRDITTIDTVLTLDPDLEVQDPTEFETIAKDISYVHPPGLWNIIIQNESEFKIFISKLNVPVDKDIFNGIDTKTFFDKYIIIGAGTPVFRAGTYNFEISDLTKDNNLIHINTEFTIIEENKKGLTNSNHFIKVLKGDYEYQFRKTLIKRNFNFGKPIYMEPLSSFKRSFSILEDKAFLINSYEEFQLLKLELGDNANIQLPPNIDFELYSVVAVVTRKKINLMASIEVEKIVFTNRGLDIVAKLEEKIDVNAGILSPAQFVRIFKTNVEINKLEIK